MEAQEMIRDDAATVEHDTTPTPDDIYVTDDPRTMDSQHRSGALIWALGAIILGLCGVAYWAL